MGGERLWLGDGQRREQAFAALNLTTQALATADPIGAARRSGRSRAWIALGPVLALPLSAMVALHFGPRPIFFLLAAVALTGLLATRQLPSAAHALPQARRGLKLPNSLDVWSFLEGLTLDGLFIIGLSYLGKDRLPGGAVVAASVLLALRYLGEILLSPVGGHLGGDRLRPAASARSSWDGRPIHHIRTFSFRFQINREREDEAQT